MHAGFSNKMCQVPKVKIIVIVLNRYYKVILGPCIELTFYDTVAHTCRPGLSLPYPGAR